MTPIESEYDTRLVTLIGVAINAMESLALAVDVNPEQLLAEYLYISNKMIHEHGEESYLQKLNRSYPLLREAID